MQNRKNFLKTAAIGVAGAIGLTLIPSKALAENETFCGPTRWLNCELKYKLSIGRMIELKNSPIQCFQLHPGMFVSTQLTKIQVLHNEINDNLRKELGLTVGRITPKPFCSEEFGCGYAFFIDTYPPNTTTRLGNTLVTTKIDKTMQHIIDGTPDPFMEYPYVD